MKGTFPIITCDSVDGCDQWTPDWYTATADNWVSLMEPGWVTDVHDDRVPDLCPQHAGEPMSPPAVGQGGCVCPPGSHLHFGACLPSIPPGATA